MLPRLTFFPVLCLSATLLSCSPSDSSIIKVGYQHPSADMAAKVANLFVDGLMDYNRALNIGSSPVEDLTYLVEAQSEKLAELEAKLVAYREKHNTMGKSQINRWQNTYY